MAVLTSLCILVSMATVSGLRSGVVENWIHKAFCTGSEVFVHIPWDCSGYLHCDVSYANWTNCEANTKFDANIKSCLFTSNTCQPPAVAAATYCPKYAHLKFAHPKHCAMYYDCSMVEPSSAYGLLIYEDECPFQLLFDNQRGMCRADEDSNPVPCSNKPQQQCDYVKECRGTGLPTDCTDLPDGANPDPRGVFLPNYILCSRGTVVGRYSCDISQNKVFDPVARTCSSTYRFAIENYCKQNPTAIIADPLMCSMYYDCSVMNHHEVLGPYKTECSYLYLFDLQTKSCRRYNESVSCDYRSEPKSPCEYRVSDCAAGESCLPCSANCTGLPDGLNPYPGFEGTRFYVVCDKERTLNFRSCLEPQIFLSSTRNCGIKDPLPPPPTTPQPTEPPPPPTTTPQPTQPPPPPTTPQPTEPPPPPTTPQPTEPPPPPPTTAPPPICDKPCGLDEHAVNLASMFEEVDRLNESAALRPEFICASPPTLSNARTEIFTTSTLPVTRYTCDEDHTMCGRRPMSMCLGEDEWTDPGAIACVRNVWRQFTAEFPSTFLYDCPPDGPFKVKVKGRQLNEIMVLSLANGNNLSEIGMLLYAKPEGNLLAFGYDNLESVLSPYQLINSHEWIMHFSNSRIKLYLNGEFVGETDNNIDYSSTLALTVVSGFLPEHIEIWTSIDEMMKDVDVNLALRRPVTTKTITDLGVSVVTDGNNIVLFDSHSCWSSLDKEHYLIIDLGLSFRVKTVVTTIPDCAGTTCGIIDTVKIYITSHNDVASYQNWDVCSLIWTQLKPSTVNKHRCTTAKMGRYVSLVGREKSHQMALCEVEVYGARAELDLPMFNCPDPPGLPHATVTVSYSSDGAQATYTCDDTYVTCSGVNVIHCSDGRGWNSQPLPCVKGEAPNVDTFNICPLHLGSGLEIRFVPQLMTFLVLKEPMGPFLQIRIDNAAGQEVSSIVTTDLSPNPFKLNKEARLTIIALSGSLEFFVDGILVASLPRDNKLITRYTSFEASQEVEYIKYTYLMGGIGQGESKLTIPVAATASSTYRNSPDIAKDGDAASEYPHGSCWYSAYGDKEPWIQFELQQLYYVNAVTVSIKNTCPGCGAINIALNKPAFGSAGSNATSLPENLVDGKTDKCFSSQESDTWWMVDLEDSNYLIEKLKIVGPHTTANVTVSVYEEDPTTGNPSVSVCTTHVAALSDPQELVCDAIVMGRYIRLETGAGVFTACQVEIYAKLVDSLHDFVVKVYKEEPSPESRGQICNSFEGRVFLTETVRCKEEMYGRFVRIEQANQVRNNELMTLCEVVPHVSSPFIKSRFPYACPKPPGIEFGDVTVSYNSFEAMATYKCHEGYRFCSGSSDVITCNNDDGWDRDPESCSPNYMDVEGQIHIPCGLQIGDTVLVDIMPWSDGFSVVFFSGTQMTYVLHTYPNGFVVQAPPVSLSTELNVYYNEILRLEITALSEGLYISINGQRLKVPEGPTPHITWFKPDSPNPGRPPLFRKLVFMTDTESNAVFRYKENLVSPSTVVQAGSTETGSAEKIVDGETTLANPYCWASGIGDSTLAFITVDLGTQYFVDGIRYGTHKDCCANTNHDISVLVHKQSPTEESPYVDLCVYHEAYIPANTMKNLPCIKRRFGRYLKIEGLKRSGPNENLNLCELEVYGGVAIYDPSKLPGAEDPCPTWEGYLSVKSPRLCFKLSTNDEADSYNKAQDACALKGGHLIDLDTKAKHDYIQNYLSSLGAEAHDPNVSYYMFYVGLKKSVGVYRWTSRSTYVETWYEKTTDQECGVLYKEGLGDLYGYEPRRYICEIPMFRYYPKHIILDK